MKIFQRCSKTELAVNLLARHICENCWNAKCEYNNEDKHPHGEQHPDGSCRVWLSIRDQYHLSPRELFNR